MASRAYWKGPGALALKIELTAATDIDQAREVPASYRFGAPLSCTY